jgi:hypothetical protein
VLVPPCPTIISPNAPGRHAVRRYVVGRYILRRYAVRRYAVRRYAVRRYVVLPARPIGSSGPGRAIRAAGVGGCLLEDREELRRLLPDRTDRLLAHPLPSVIIAV